jgi:glutamine amidotransferase
MDIIFFFLFYSAITTITTITTVVMCQLLAISSTEPTPTFSSSLLAPFIQRGGNTDVHSHGWGLAYSKYCKHEKKLRIQTIRDASPAATSTKVQHLLMNQSDEGILDTHTLLAHIRYATAGEVSINNVHPFHRELFGVEFVFAHNGDVPMFKHDRDRGAETDTDMNMNMNMNTPSHNYSFGYWYNNHHHESSTFEPFGETDSERIFCYILNALNKRFDFFPALDELYDAIHELCAEIIYKNGQQQDCDGGGVILNFLLSVGEHIFAYSWPGKRPGSKTWNGLYYMLKPLKEDDDDDFNNRYDSDDSSDDETTQVAVIATKPLGPNVSLWKEFKRGDLLLFSNGTVSRRTVSKGLVVSKTTTKQ